MIWAPPIIVRMSDACPGQSTRVNCKYSYLMRDSKRVGTLVKKAENPRSKVMPRSWDCGFLSRLAVDVTSLRIRQRDVFPESTCPKTPTLMLRHLLGWIAATSYLLRSNNSFSITINYSGKSRSILIQSFNQPSQRCLSYQPKSKVILITARIFWVSQMLIPIISN